jgi:hypothetical protein
MKFVVAAGSLIKTTIWTPEPSHVVRHGTRSTGKEESVTYAQEKKRVYDRHKKFYPIWLSSNR